MNKFDLTTPLPASLQFLPTSFIDINSSILEKLPDSIKQNLKEKNSAPLTNRLPVVLQFSQFLQKICLRYPDAICELIDSVNLANNYSHGQLLKKISTSIKVVSGQTELYQTLRQLRHVEMSRIVWRDLAGISDIENTMEDLSSLAEAILQVTTKKHNDWLVQIHGEPIIDSTAQKADFVVFAMGKLGGRELNFSSDIDLIFAYSDTGQTNGAKSISNNEFFIKLGQALINTLNNVTEDGFVYRVDMRLRPNGQSGALAMSFSAMENYYQIHGREWERYAWIKARVVAGDRELGEQFLNQLRPFVYRKYLDYQVYQSLDEMKAMINKEIHQQGMQQNIKLGRGGIREIEFIVQSHQLVRGGREPELRTVSIKKALTSLAANQQIDENTAIKLYQAYLYLRNVEHRLQMKNDQQTHQLPTDSNEIDLLAASLGCQQQEFIGKLNGYRDFVHAEFIKIHSQQKGEEADNNWQLLWRQIVSGSNQTKENSGEKNQLITTLEVYAKSKSYRTLETRGRRIIDRLLPKILQLISQQLRPTQALNLMLDILSAIGGRSAYLSLLDQFPTACKQLIQLCAASPWISKWIADHPIVLDTLINPRTDLYTFNNNNIENLIESRISNETDNELKHDILRQLHHSSLLQIAIADLHHQYSAKEIRVYISKTAETIVNRVIKLCQDELKEKFGLPMAKDGEDYFAVIAYGKLGSRELSYNADLDLVFIYDDQTLHDETEGGKKTVRIDYYFSRLVQRILTMLSMQTTAGKLYDIDTRLRPSGKSGLLVSSLTQYIKYQHEQAWVWEHQALVKARLLSNAPGLQSKFNRLRRKVLSKQRNESELVKDIADMRARMREAIAEKEKFSQKHVPGGMVDIEFISQFLVLNNAYQYSDICLCRSVNEILQFCSEHQLMKQQMIELLKKTYSDLLKLENQYKLHGKLEKADENIINLQMSKVNELWQRIFS